MIKIININRKSWKRTDLKQKQKKSRCNHWSQSPQITSALLAQLPQTGLWHFKCQTLGSVCSSFGPALPPCQCLLLQWLLPLLPTLCRLPQPLYPPCIPPSAPLPAAAGHSSGPSYSWCAPWIKCGHWSQPGRGCYRRPPLAIFVYRLWRSTPLHLVWDVHVVLSVVVVHHRLWFCIRPIKGAHTCVHGAQDADILPRLSLVHSQS